MKGFRIHEAFWDAIPFAMQALRSKVAGNRKNTEFMKIGGYSFQACVDFYELAFTRRFGPEPSQTCLAPALFGGLDNKGVAKTLSEVRSFDLEAFRKLAEAFRPEDGCSLDAAEVMGGLLAAAISSATGFDSSAQEEFVRACDGLCVSNPFRQGGFAPLNSSVKWVSQPSKTNALDTGFGLACDVPSEDMWFHVQIWQDLQLPGTASNPEWAMSRRGLALALARHFENGGRRADAVARSLELVAKPRPPVKGSALAVPGVLEVPPPLRRQVMSLLEISLRILGQDVPLESKEHVEALFQAFPKIHAALAESVLTDLVPQKPATKKKKEK
jgi:hypothetical protein